MAWAWYRINEKLFNLTLASIGVLLLVSLVLATVGVPGFIIGDEPSAAILETDRRPVAAVATLFAAGEAWAVIRGLFGWAWANVLAVTAFTWAFVPSMVYVFVPPLAFNVLFLAALHGLDLWLVYG